MLDKSAAEDKDAVVVTRETATQHNATSHRRPRPALRRAGLRRPAGVPDPARRHPRHRRRPTAARSRSTSSLDAGGPLTVAALKDGTIQAADLFTTDASIAANDFVVLEDPKNNFAAQNVVPLINGNKLGNPAVADVLNLISQKMDTAALTDLNRRLDAPDKPDPAQVARDWLSAAGIG